MDVNQKEWWSSYLATEDSVIVDVRTEEECANGTIPGSINRSW